MGILQSQPCTLVPFKEQFERERDKKVYASKMLKFKGVGEFNVYNCSVPFTFKGKTYLFGRVEMFTEWVQSNVHLFEKTGEDEYTCVATAMTFNLEDPFIVKINGEMVLGGTRVTKNGGGVSDYRCDFYRGTPDNLKYFTGGPSCMKDIRLAELSDGRVGVFTHFRTEGSCLTGFAIINSLNELNVDVINKAPLINHRAFGDAWGGPNQVYLLSTGLLGCISHHGYLLEQEDYEEQLRVYCCTSYVLDPKTRDVFDFKVIGTKSCYPHCEAKLQRLSDCAFVSGITMRRDGKCDLYSGVGDVAQGRCTIDYPFEGYGTIVSDLDF